MTSLRLALWSVTALAAAGLGFLIVQDQLGRTGSNSGIGSITSTIIGPQIGGPFELVTDQGETVDQGAFEGRPFAIFFGFTHCPDVCPTSLYELATWREALGDDADKLGFAFVSVDPERDTPEVLSNYIDAFSEDIIGLTGSKEQIADVIAAYRVYARKVPLDDGDYTMDHTANIFLMKADGMFHGTIAYQEDKDVALQKLRNLIATAS